MTHAQGGLIERLEQAKEPDRELDALIWAEVDGRDVRWDGNKLLARSRRSPRDECWLGTIDPGKVNRNFSVVSGHQPPIPLFTSSIDAALTLVPEACKWWMQTYNDGRCEAQIFHGRMESLWGPRVRWTDEDHAMAPSPALALCSAALKVRSHPAAPAESPKE